MTLFHMPWFFTMICSRFYWYRVGSRRWSGQTCFKDSSWCLDLEWYLVVVFTLAGAWPGCGKSVWPLTGSSGPIGIHRPSILTPHLGSFVVRWEKGLFCLRRYLTSTPGALLGWCSGMSNRALKSLNIRQHYVSTFEYKQLTIFEENCYLSCKAA